MAPGDFDPSIHQQLGRLVEGMEGLKDSIRRMEDQSRRSEDKAAESRAVVHRRLDEMVDRVGDVEQTVALVKDDVTDVKPVTDDMKRLRLMGVGFLSAIGMGGAALGFTFADALKRLLELVMGK